VEVIPETPAQKGQFAVEMWPIDRPKDYPKNARRWSKEAVAKVAASIREFGWRQPVVVDADDVIVIGHLRRAAGKHIGLAECPVHVARDLSPAKVRALRLADNRTAQEATWDMETLATEFGELKAMDFDLSMTAFDSRELDALLLKPNPAEDDIPPTPEVPTTRLGDLWEMGGHRLLCGDATDAASVARLMDGKLADLVFTDPPYGVGYDGGTVVRERLKGDENTSLYAPCCDMAARYSKSGAAFYLWHAGVKGIAAAAAAAAAAAGYAIRCEIVWNKNLAQFGSLSAQYKQKHEPCYYCFKRGYSPKWYGPTNEVTVWDCDRSKVNDLHPTQKPVAIARRAIVNSSKLGHIVLDLFGGSGCTLVAADQSKRVCFMVELESKYCDVIIIRWQNLTGKIAVLADGDYKGATFEHVKEGRRREWEDQIGKEAFDAAE
jgi:DNA modification methylase